MNCGPLPTTHPEPRWVLASLFALVATIMTLLMRVHERTLLAIDFIEQGWFSLEKLDGWLLIDGASLLLAYLGVWLLVRFYQERWSVIGSRKLPALLTVFVALIVLGVSFFAWLFFASLSALIDLGRSAHMELTITLHVYNLLQYAAGLLLMTWLSLRLFQRTLVPGEPPAVTPDQLAWFVTLLYLALTLKIQNILFELFKLDFLPFMQLGLKLVLMSVLLESAVVLAVAYMKIREPQRRRAPGRLLLSVALLVLLRTLIVLAFALVCLQLNNFSLLPILFVLQLVLLWPLTALSLGVVTWKAQAAPR